MSLARPVVESAVQCTIQRWGRERSLADDLIQDTLTKLCVANYRALRNFRGDSSASLAKYLRVIASSAAADSFRADQMRALSLDDPECAPVVPDERSEREIERKLLLDRIDRCLTGQKPRDRWIFWLYHRHGFSPKAIAELPIVDLGRSGVETLIYRLTRAVADCVKKFSYFSGEVEGDSA